MTSPPLRVLCLDIEGGFGGSSRSLFELVRHLDRDRAQIEIWCKRAGPVQNRYREIGIPVQVTPAMPKVSSLPRLTRNLYVYAVALRDFIKSAAFRRELEGAARDRFDLVHFNHEALFLLARCLKPRVRTPLTMHIRTNLHDTIFARWQDRVIADTVDHLVYITENERRTLERLSNRRPSGTVVFNVVSLPDRVEPHGRVPKDDRFKIACLSNYSWYRGLDRLVEVAEAIAKKGRRDVLFVMAGDMALSRSLPGELGRIARRGGTLADYAALRGMADMFLFLGHVSEPESVLVACDVLAKPTREANPWGRDILEALGAGRPVLSVGSDETFLEDGVNGVLKPEFDAAGWADEIIRLADDRDLCERMAEAGRARVLALCDGPARAADLLNVWQSTVRTVA